MTPHSSQTAISERLLELAANLTEAQQTCGDVIDRLPCLRCGAMSLRACALPMAGRIAATTLINNTPGLHAQLLAKREAAALQSQEPQP